MTFKNYLNNMFFPIFILQGFFYLNYGPFFPGKSVDSRPFPIQGSRGNGRRTTLCLMQDKTDWLIV